jgi:hypothetical protein
MFLDLYGSLTQTILESDIAEQLEFDIAPDNAS